ncbi:DUF5388 domain-containing protein [Levilactobacillus brevis]|nr:DUF5388 domain-containing protein [Levilactobacillus brevis]TOY83920.1 hypothetical protein DIS15_12115 [Levilactobacillus brevis]
MLNYKNSRCFGNKKRATIIFDEDVSDQTISVNKSVSSVTFDTTLRIDNHLKNFMKAMVILGYSSTQQNGLAQLQKNFFESLTESEQNTLTTQIQTLETGDANKVKSK